MPDVVSVVLNGTVRAELTCVADVSPALFCKCILILVIVVQAQLGVWKSYMRKYLSGWL